MECPCPCKSLSCPTQVLDGLQDLTYLEFFAGEGEVFRCIRGDHHPSCAVDLEYMEGRGHAMDVNSPSGLATCLLYLLILARGGTFFLEQPASSLIRHYFRVYPRAFAEQIRRLFPKLVGNGEGKPRVQPADGALAFSRYPWSDWPEASLMETVRYLGGSRSLNPPQKWKNVFPRSMSTFPSRAWSCGTLAEGVEACAQIAGINLEPGQLQDAMKAPMAVKRETPSPGKAVRTDTQELTDLRRSLPPSRTASPAMPSQDAVMNMINDAVLKHRETDQNMISALQNHISALEGKVLQNARAAPVTQAPEFTSMKNQLAEALSKVQELQNDNAKRAEKEKELEEALARKQDTHKKGRCGVPDAIHNDYVEGGEKREILEMSLLQCLGDFVRKVTVMKERLSSREQEDEKVSKDDVQRLAPGHVAIPEEKPNPEVLGEKPVPELEKYMDSIVAKQGKITTMVDTINDKVQSSAKSQECKPQINFPNNIYNVHYILLNF
ncbi:unnamed protein product [Cladocopium goreaui]|uniref:Uncharacterized protein n=1 Tax=Cladocopium goreaui TaxID=2562237 RepID=A0A9P1G6G1_9DINO|nr:unnamed protein product [Cladocopium goreaui]